MKRAEELGVDLPQLSLADLQAFSPLVADDVFAVLTVEGSLAARDHIGGTAPNQVRAAIGARPPDSDDEPADEEDRQVRNCPRDRAGRPRTLPRPRPVRAARDVAVKVDLPAGAQDPSAASSTPTSS